MSFIHLGFIIAGVATMTLPIWIHLLLRQRAKSMEIGSIRFVKNVVRRTKSCQRIQRWLLLVLRTLAVLLLGLLFARPYLPDTPADGRTREVAILIDRSASMTAEHTDGESAIQAAKRRAIQYVGTLGEQASVHIGLFDASGVESISLADISTIDAGATGTKFDEAFAWATDVLAASDRTDRSVLLLSDLQRSGKNQPDLSRFPLDITVHIEDPAPAISQNLSIVSAVPSQVELRPGVPISIEARVHNGGEFSVTKVTVSADLTGPDGNVQAKQLVSLTPGQRQTIELKVPVETAGNYQGSVSIDRDDPFPWDNRRYVALQAKHPDRLLLVDGAPGRTHWENATYFIETALRLQTPVGEGAPTTFEIERLVWDRGSGLPDLAGYRLIVVANIGRLTASDAGRLVEFLASGGNVLWFMGERTTSAVLDPIVQSGLLGETKFSPATDAIARVSNFDHQHPALAAFADPQHGDLRELTAHRLVPIESLDPDAVVLIQSPRGPLVLARQAGKGRIVLVMTSADRSWSNWPQNRLFVPLVRQLAAWLTGQLDRKQPVVAETIAMPGDEPGIQKVGESLLVRNIDPSESEIGRYSEEQFREAVRLPQVASPSEDADRLAQFALAGVARSDEKWPIVVWVLLGILATELLLASRIRE